MVHIGDTEKRYDPKVIHPLLALLEPGDILTHYFTPNPGGVTDVSRNSPSYRSYSIALRCSQPHWV